MEYIEMVFDINVAYDLIEGRLFMGLGFYYKLLWHVTDLSWTVSYIRVH
jgi:hypothetical protein